MMICVSTFWSVLACVIPWKHKFPLDTEDEEKVGISSEDEAQGMPLVDHQACLAVRPAQVPVTSTATPGTSTTPSATAGSAAAAALAVGAPGPDEVVVKKAALVTMKRQVAA